MALLGLTLATPLAIGYYFAWHPLDDDRGFGAGIIATGATLVVGLAAIVSALVGGRQRRARSPRASRWASRHCWRSG